MPVVAVFGPTGATGLLFIEQILKDPAYSVRSMARSPDALTELIEASEGRLTVLKGDLYDKASVRATIQGSDAVVFAAGVASISQAMKSNTTIYSVGGQNVMDAMKALRVNRLIAVTSHGVITHDPSAAWVYTYFLKAFLLRNMYDDMIRFEGKVSATELDWTIVRPTQLMDGPLKSRGGLWTGEGVLPKGSRHQVDRKDVAQLLVKLVQEGGSSGKMISISC